MLVVIVTQHNKTSLCIGSIENRVPALKTQLKIEYTGSKEVFVNIPVDNKIMSGKT